VSGLLDSNTLLFAICGVAGFIGLILVVRGLFADRARGRRRCPKCWYDMSASPTRVCSECGYEAGSDRPLRRTRRRWRVAAAGALLLLAVPAAMLTPKIREDGWVSVVPTTVLVLWAPRYESEDHPVFAELLRRIDAVDESTADPVAPLWEWQWRYLVNASIPRGGSGRATAARGKRQPGDPHDILITRAVDENVLRRLGLIHQMAEEYSVDASFSASVERDLRQTVRSTWEMQFEVSYPWLKYRVTAYPRVPGSTELPSWAPRKIQSSASRTGGIAIERHEGTSMPDGEHAFIFDVVVEYAPIGIYGSYGPEEFAVYDRFEVAATIKVD